MDPWKVTVDADTCIGCQTCVEIAPTSYRMNDASVAEFVGFNEDQDTVMQAAQACPVDAIIITDPSTGQKLWPK